MHEFFPLTTPIWCSSRERNLNVNGRAKVVSEVTGAGDPGVTSTVLKFRMCLLV